MSFHLGAGEQWKEIPAYAKLSEFLKRYPHEDWRFEADVYHLIRAFVDEAVKPWQQAFTDALNQSALTSNEFIERMRKP